MSLRGLYILMAVVGILLLAALVLNTVSIFDGYNALDKAYDEYISAQNDAQDLILASDYLTSQVRGFVLSSDREYLDSYFEEANVSRRRDGAVEKIRTRMAGENSDAISFLERSLELSNALMDTEYYAFRLVADAAGYSLQDLPSEIREVPVSAEDAALGAQEKLLLARDLVFGLDYQSVKEEISENAAACTDKMIEAMRERKEKNSDTLNIRLHIQFSLITAMLAVIILYLVFTERLIVMPIERFIDSVENGSQFDYTGLREMSFLSSRYNELLDRTKEDTAKLSYDAMHDSLTDLYNRAGYDEIMEEHMNDRIAFMILDVDGFKQFNDVYGHAVGDSVLQRVAKVLKKSFRSEDYICRIGGDEFVVIMVNADSSLKELVERKLISIAEMLRDEEDSVPGITLSVGVAFSDREDPQGNIFEDADTALYRVKDNGRNGFEFF
jgi:diguanylate cyclase (GGDEF)-like protein